MSGVTEGRSQKKERGRSLTTLKSVEALGKPGLQLLKRIATDSVRLTTLSSLRATTVEAVALIVLPSPSATDLWAVVPMVLPFPFIRQSGELQMLVSPATNDRCAMAVKT